MKIDITDEPNRVTAQKRISLENPDKYWVPVWEPDIHTHKRLYMVDEEEIKKNLSHYQRIIPLIWFVHHNGYVSMKAGIITVEKEEV